MNTKKIRLKQLDQQLAQFQASGTIMVPNVGWIRSIRNSLGMSLQQLAKKMGISLQSVQEMEMREREKTITLKTLGDVADALDMKLVYALVPKDGSLDRLIERKARALASEIVQRTSQHMLLEDQSVSYERLQEAVEERTQELKNDIPKSLWD